MSSSRNLFQILFGESRQFTIRFYPRERWFHQYCWGNTTHGSLFGIGYRALDADWARFSIDFGKLSFVFENYKLGGN